MRDGELVVIHLQVSKRHNVDVESAVTPTFVAHAAVFCLNALKLLKESVRFTRTPRKHNNIEVRGRRVVNAGKGERWGLNDAGCCLHRHTIDAGDRVNGVAQRALAIAQVATQSEHNWQLDPQSLLPDHESRCGSALKPAV
jgi:hypothetical protein